MGKMHGEERTGPQRAGKFRMSPFYPFPFYPFMMKAQENNEIVVPNSVMASQACTAHDFLDTVVAVLDLQDALVGDRRSYANCVRRVFVTTQ